MEIFVHTLNGHEVAALQAEPSWKLSEVLSAVPEVSGLLDCRRRLFLEQTELSPTVTLGEIGAKSGTTLTLVRTPPLRIICGCATGVVSVWCTASKDCLCTWRHQHASLMAVVASPGGQEVLTLYRDGTADLRSIASGDITCSLQGHQDLVFAAVFSADGHQIATASCDRTAKIWSVASGQCMQTLVGHRGEVRSVAFSPNGQMMVTASFDGTGGIWCVASGRCLHKLIGHTRLVVAADFSPNGLEALTASQDCKVKIWSAASGELVTEIKFGGVLGCAIFSPTGAEVLAYHNKVAQTASVASGQILRTLGGHADFLASIDFSPDGEFILTHSADGEVKLWHATGEAPLRTFAMGRGLMSAALF